MAQKPPAAPKTRWADEAADMSPDFRPIMKPKVLPDPDTIYLDDTPAPSRGGSRHGIIENLSYETTQQELLNFFQDSHCRVVNLKIQLDERGASLGTALVEFAKPEDLDKAMKKSGARLRGRAITISPEGRRGSSSRNISRAGAPRDQRPQQPRRREETPRATAAPVVVDETPKERPKLVLLPRSVPLEERHKKPEATPVPVPTIIVTPVQAVASPTNKSEPEVKNIKAEPRERRERRQPREPREAKKEQAPVAVEEDFFVKAGKKTVKVVAKEEKEIAPAKQGGALKNRFRGLVESESDEQN